MSVGTPTVSTLSVIVGTSSYVGPAVSPGTFIATYKQSQPNSVQLSWNEIPMTSRNGNITGYVLTVARAVSSSSDNTINVITLSPEVLFYEVTGLLLNSFYNFSLAAQTSAGVGPEIVIQVSTFLTGMVR